MEDTVEGKIADSRGRRFSGDQYAAASRLKPLPQTPLRQAGAIVRNDQNGGAQAVLDLGVGENDPRALLLHHPATVGDVFGEQVTGLQFGEVFDIRRQVQLEAVAVLDDLT